jgi:hypothetical protein
MGSELIGFTVITLVLLAVALYIRKHAAQDRHERGERGER